jgi:hypothetical protein
MIELAFTVYDFSIYPFLMLISLIFPNVIQYVPSLVAHITISGRIIEDWI